MTYYYSSAFLQFVAALIAVSSVSVSALELTEDNFVEMTAGKTVFIKFFAPWCGHCKAMADDWKKLEDDFAGHEIALVAEVDCTSEKGDTVCEDFQVDGFPTIAWGDASSAQTYDGARDYESLKAFADKFVTKAVCSLSRLDACSAEETADIEAINGKSDQELLDTAKKIAETAKMEEKKYDNAVEDIQTQYERLTEAFNGKLEDIKTEHKFKYVEQVMKKRNIKNPFKDMDDEDDDDDDDDDKLEGEL